MPRTDTDTVHLACQFCDYRIQATIECGKPRMAKHVRQHHVGQKVLRRPRCR